MRFIIVTVSFLVIYTVYCVSFCVWNLIFSVYSINRYRCIVCRIISNRFLLLLFNLIMDIRCQSSVSEHILYALFHYDNEGNWIHDNRFIYNPFFCQSDAIRQQPANANKPWKMQSIAVIDTLIRLIYMEMKKKSEMQCEQKSRRALSVVRIFSSRPR